MLRICHIELGISAVVLVNKFQRMQSVISCNMAPGEQWETLTGCEGLICRTSEPQPRLSTLWRESLAGFSELFAKKVPLEERNELEMWGFTVMHLPQVGSMGMALGLNR